MYPQDPTRSPRRRTQAPAARPRRLPLLLGVLLLAVLAGLWLGRSALAPDPDLWEPSAYGDAGDGGLAGQLQDLAREDPAAQALADHMEDYPQQLLELAVRNPETVDFVRDYPREKDKAPADTVEEARQGTIPLLLQWDPRWGCAQYGDGPMALNGCGPTALSMVICGLTGDKSATPYAVAQYAQEMGYYVDGAGTSWDLMRLGCEHFGLSARELPLDEGVMKGALEDGEPIICSVGPGDFTTSGHFIVLSGVEEGNFQVRDPNRRANSEKLWDYETLAPQISNLWAFCAEAS